MSLRKTPTIIVTILILIAVLTPGSNIPAVGFAGIDKPVHIIMFFTWTIAIRLDFPALKPLVVFLLGMAFSFFTEVLQLFAEDRSFDLYDMVADAIGIIIGLLLSKPVVKLVRQILKLDS